MDTELYHHGILGMKWGVRRYQNKDGSLTAQGKKRKARTDLGEDGPSGTSKAKGGSSKPKTKSVSEMTDDELRSYINRRNMERQALDLDKQVSALQPKQVSKGQKFMNSFKKDVLAPAAKDAGKNLMTKLLNKEGAKLLGLSENKTKDAYADLKKEVEGLELEKKKSEYQKYFQREREKQAKNKE